MIKNYYKKRLRINTYLLRTVDCKKRIVEYKVKIVDYKVKIVDQENKIRTYLKDYIHYNLN